MTDQTHSRAAGNLTVQLGPKLKLQWTEWCESRGLKAGKVVRQLVEKALADGFPRPANGEQTAPKVTIGRGPDQGAKIGREIYFTPSEVSAVETVASAQGFGFHEWVVSAVRTALAKVPAFGQLEVEALTQSNLRLAQIVSVLGAQRRSSADEDLTTQLGALEAQLREHVEAASVVMAQGAQRWQLKA